MVFCDPRQKECPIIYANAAFCDLSGYEEQEIVGRNCRFLRGPGTNPDAVQKIRDAIARRVGTAANSTQAIALIKQRPPGLLDPPPSMEMPSSLVLAPRSIELWHAATPEAPGGPAQPH